MNQLNIGIIGTGMAFERLHYPAFQQLKNEYKIAAICDLDREKLEKARNLLGLDPSDAYTDYRDLIQRKDLDAFDILVPIELNLELTEAVAKVGKPLICEKPLAPTRETAEKARQLTEKYQIPIMIAENYRYSEEHNLIRDLVRNQEIGNTYYFIQNRVVNFPKEMFKDSFAATDWRQQPEFSGGVIYDTGVHDLAGLRHIFGAIDSVHALGIPSQEDFSPYAVLQGNLKFKDGVIGHYSFFTVGEEMQKPLVGLRIFGSKGMIYLEEPACGTINIAYNDGTNKQIPYQPDKGFYNELLNFYKAAVGEEVISVTPEMEFGDAETIFALLESAKTNQVVSVDKTREFVMA